MNILITSAIQDVQGLDFFGWMCTGFMILAAILAGAKLIGEFSKLIGRPVKWVKKKEEDHKLLMSTVKKVNLLEEKDNVIKHDVDDILALLKDHIDTDKKNTRATFRSSLYRMHSDFTSRGFITKEGLKTFLECGAAYELADGDDIYHDKLKPEVMKLPIKDTDCDGVFIEEFYN